MIKKNNERSEVIDIAKGIAIYLVVLGHLQTGLCNTSVILIASCHMPVFFLLSGLFFEKSYKKYPTEEFFVIKTKTLLVPYAVWSLVAFVVNAGMLFLQENYKAIGTEAYDIFVNARSVWFLVVLYFANLIAFVLRKISHKKTWLFLLLCLGLWIGMLLLGRLEMFAIYKLEWLFPYFLLGVSLSYKNWIFNMLEKITTEDILTKLVSVIIIIVIYTMSSLHMYRRDLFEEFYIKFDLALQNAHYYICYYVIGILGISAIVMLSTLINSFVTVSRALSCVGKYSLDIYVIHMFLVKAFFIGFDVLPVGDRWTSQGALVIWALVIILFITYVVHFVLRKVKIYRMSLGGR